MCLIDGSLIHHTLNAANVRTDAHGIVAGAARRLTIRNTEIHTFSGDAFQIDPGRAAPGWGDIVVEGCRFWLQPLPAAVNGFAAGVVPGENAIDTKASATLAACSADHPQQRVLWLSCRAHLKHGGAEHQGERRHRDRRRHHPFVGDRVPAAGAGARARAECCRSHGHDGRSLRGQHPGPSDLEQHLRARRDDAPSLRRPLRAASSTFATSRCSAPSSRRKAIGPWNLACRHRLSWT